MNDEQDCLLDVIANNELQEQLKLILLSILSNKQNSSNLNAYEAKKKLFVNIIEHDEKEDPTKIIEKTVKIFYLYFTLHENFLNCSGLIFCFKKKLFERKIDRLIY
jgi:hypothetical protein